MDRCLIVDGHNLLFQMFFGMPAKIKGVGGVSLHGVVGFLGSIFKTVEKLNINKCFVIFDNEYGSFRKGVNEQYKANRVDYSKVSEDENPFSQLPIIKKCLDYLNITNIESPFTFETDDVIASYCLKNTNQINYIMSYDSDFFQLLSDTTYVYRYRGDSSVLWDSSKLLSDYKIKPSQLVDYKCLVGDSADNIKGIPGIGKVTAARLLNTYGSMDKIFNDLDNIKPEKLAKEIEKNILNALLNKDIIKLGFINEIPKELDSVNLELKTTKTFDVLKSIGVY